MSTEERLARSLHEEADSIEVDVSRLHAATRARLAPARRSRRQVWLRPAVAVVAVLAVVVGVVAVVRIGGDDPRDVAPAGTSKAGGVATGFTCPGQVVVDQSGREVDDSFLPSLADGPRAAADDAGAPRYSYDRQRDKATLRLGNEDGSLASTAGFERVGNSWELRSTTKCSGLDRTILVPVRDPLHLGKRLSDPYPAKGMTEGDQSVLVDDRDYYDVAGLVQHRTIWAFPCQKVFCVAAGRPDSMITWTGEHPNRPVPEDLSQVFLPPDDTVGMRNPYGFWAVYDPHSEVRDVRTTAPLGGAGVAAVQVAQPGWPGRLYLLLAPWDEVKTIEVRTAVGTQAYAKDAITGSGNPSVLH
jgi:hypothetical protein